MGNVKKMQSVIADLRSYSNELNALAEELSEMFFPSVEVEKENHPSQKYAPEKPLKLEDVRAVLADIARAGHTDEVRALIEKYGADKLSAVDPKNYAALLADAEVIHAK